MNSEWLRIIGYALIPVSLFAAGISTILSRTMYIGRFSRKPVKGWVPVAFGILLSILGFYGLLYFTAPVLGYFLSLH